MAILKRLSKVARELNVGISTIVEFLNSQNKEVSVPLSYFELSKTFSTSFPNLTFSLFFELPIVMYILAKIGILGPVSHSFN